MPDFLDIILNPPVEPVQPIPHPPIRRTKAINLTRNQKHDCRGSHFTIVGGISMEKMYIELCV
jgi:hypothetical protein